MIPLKLALHSPAQSPRVASRRPGQSPLLQLASKAPRACCLPPSRPSPPLPPTSGILQVAEHTGPFPPPCLCSRSSLPAGVAQLHAHSGTRMGGRPAGHIRDDIPLLTQAIMLLLCFSSKAVELLLGLFMVHIHGADSHPGGIGFPGQVFRKGR